MSRMLAFASRCTKELLRDPLTIAFSIGFPAVVMLLLTAIQSRIPVPLFQPESLTPGICVFGLSFIALFSAQLIAKDRETDLLARLFTTPMTSADFILGYTLPLLPIALGQSTLCYALALVLGMDFTVRIIPAVLAMLPMSLTFIGLGLICGSVFNDKQVGGLCGALLTNLTAWLSGAWFDLELIGGAFKTAAYALPFAHGVDMGRDILAGKMRAENMIAVLVWGAALTVIAVPLFRRKMRS